MVLKNDDAPPRSVLVIDDDQSLVKLLKDNLKLEGYRVYSGNDGNVAVTMATKHRPDVILMDVSMPKMNGLKAFEQLRSNQKTSHIPVIFISEMMSQVIYPVVESSPRAAHLKKPLDLVDLSSFLRQFIERFTK